MIIQAPHARQILTETAPLISGLSRIPCRAEVQHFKRRKEDDVANHERYEVLSTSFA